MDQLTIDQFRQLLPENLKKSLNNEVLGEINTKLAEPEMYEAYRENLLGYVSVLREGKFKVSSYINAVKYVSHKMRGVSNTEAYSNTFPNKVIEWQQKNTTPKDQSSYISMYNKSKLVMLIFEQTLTPMWIMNQDVYQEAINTQATLMLTAKSEMVRSHAANSLLTQLKPPETKKIELDIGMKQDNSIDMLVKATEEYAAQQKMQIKSGLMDAQQIAHSKLITDAEYEEVG